MLIFIIKNVFYYYFIKYYLYHIYIFKFILLLYNIIMSNINVRKARQIVNNNLVLNILLDTTLSISNTIKEIKNKGNIQAFTRLKEYTNLTDDEIINKCRQDEYFAKITAFSIAKCSSRQGSKDESNDYKTINNLVNIPNKKLKELGKSKLTPLKTGLLINHKLRKTYDKTCMLKTIDATLELDNKYIFITHKNIVGGGGHQDNVFNELSEFIDFTKKFNSLKKRFNQFTDYTNYLTLISNEQNLNETELNTLSNLKKSIRTKFKLKENYLLDIMDKDIEFILLINTEQSFNLTPLKNKIKKNKCSNTKIFNNNTLSDYIKQL